MSETKTVQVGPGFASLLTLLFIGLKLTEHIDWSWWWVFSPMWIGLGLAVVILAICLPFILAAQARNRRFKAKYPHLSRYL